MRFMIVALAAVSVASGPTSAFAQTLLPETSRAQSQSDAIGQSIDARQRNLQQSQQNQFETNQLRGDIQRQTTSPPIGPPVICGAGARC